MHRLAVLSLLLVVSLAVAMHGCGDGESERTPDLATGLREFVFQRVGGLGFCPEPGSLRQAIIEHDAATGTLRFTASIFGEPNGCDPSSMSASCPPAITVADRTLTDDEAATVLKSFRRVVVTQTDAHDCGLDDRCLIRDFRWTNVDADGEERQLAVDDESCVPRLRPDEADRLLGVLDNLANHPSPSTDPPGS